jgi:ferric-dicitrate binding protein FerR (iron transport regulator)
MSMQNENDPIATLLQIAGRRPAVPADVTARVREAVREEWERSARRRTRRRFALAAAAVVVLVAGGLVMFRPAATVAPSPAAPRAIIASVETMSGSAIGGDGRFVEAGARLRTGDAMETARGATASLRWGAATLRMDGGTRVRLDSPRGLFLDRGAVFIASNGERVVVSTPLGDVHDVGTEFEVRMVDDALRVRVREGQVDLRRNGATHTAAAGVELAADARGNVTQRAIPRSGSEWDWVVRAAPAITLEGRTVRAVVDGVSREKGLTAVYATGVGDARLHGSVPLTPDEALDAALAASGLIARTDGDRLIVQRRP